MAKKLDSTPALDRAKLDARIERTKKVIGENLHALRMSKGVTIKEVAKKTGLSTAKISRIEKGKDILWITDLFEMSKYYRVNAIQGMAPLSFIRYSTFGVRHSIPSTQMSNVE
jgi:transcriptional regulator with XRE-family HTH domain